jgi:hypothetical protein
MQMHVFKGFHQVAFFKRLDLCEKCLFEKCWNFDFAYQRPGFACRYYFELCIFSDFRVCFVLVRTGGSLFEFFLLLHSPKKVCQQLVRHLDEEKAYSVTESKKLAKKYGGRFWYHSLLSMHDLRSQCVKPLLLWLMLLEYRGLSRIGQQLCGTVGAGVNIRTYDRHKKKLLKNYDKQVRELVVTNNGISTWDNYSHIWAESGLRLQRDVAYVQSLFTVSAVSKLNNRPPEGFLLVTIDNGEVMDSVPASRADLEPYITKVLTKFFLRFYFFLPLGYGPCR